MSKPAIAMLGNQLGLYHKLILRPAQERLEREGYGLVYVSGGALKPNRDWGDEQHMLRNHVYPLARNYNVSGYMIIASTIGHHADAGRLESFAQQFMHKPLVCIGPVAKGVACVHPDNYSNMVTLMEHMCADDTRRRFVFIRGFSDAPETALREQGFRDVLERRGIPIDEQLILEGDYLGASSYHAMNVLMSKTRDVDAVIAANDEMAQGAVHALCRHGFSVPGDVIVSGFDDSIAANTSMPPLTTVSYSIDEMVNIAVDQLMEQIDAGEPRKKISSPVYVPARLQIRASSDLNLMASYRSKSQSRSHAFDAAKFSQLLLDNLNTIRTPEGLSAENVVSDIVSMLVNGEMHSNVDLFKQLDQLHNRPKDIYWWRHLHSLVGTALQYQDSIGLSSDALGIASSILVKIYLTTWNVESSVRVSTSLFHELRHQMHTKFNTVSTLKEMEEVLQFVVDRFPAIGGYICVYSHTGGYPDEMARVLSAGPAEQVSYDPGRSFPSCEVLPDGYLQSKFKGPVFIEPLCSGSTHLGYAVFELYDYEVFDFMNLTSFADVVTAALWRFHSGE